MPCFIKIMIKKPVLFILSGFFLSAGVFAFADQPASSLDDKPSVDTAAASGVQVPRTSGGLNCRQYAVDYLYDLKKLIAKSRENIKEVNEKIKEQAVLKRNQKREERAREYYEKGVELTNEGKLDEAREYFEKAIRITEHPEMAGYIKESQRRLKKAGRRPAAQEREHFSQIKQDRMSAKKTWKPLTKKRLLCINRKNIIRPRMLLNMSMKSPLITGPPPVI